jgi:DNA-directed RNA polymerase specialized sigma24 family protein
MTSPPRMLPEPRTRGIQIPPDGVQSGDLVAGDLARGDLSRLPEFIRWHSAPLLAYLRHRLGSQRAVEDVAQEVFLRLVRSARSGGFNGGCSVKTWLFTIVNKLHHG